MIFLLQYDRKAGHLKRLDCFDDDARAQASEARLCLELDLLKRGADDEVVVLEAESESDLRKTHNRYFRNLTELAIAPTNGTTPG